MARMPSSTTASRRGARATGQRLLLGKGITCARSFRGLMIARRHAILEKSRRQHHEQLSASARTERRVHPRGGDRRPSTMTERTRTNEQTNKTPSGTLSPTFIGTDSSTCTFRPRPRRATWKEYTAGRRRRGPIKRNERQFRKK